MKFILRVLLIFTLGYIFAKYLPLPWWSVAIPAFLVGLFFGKKPRRKRMYGKHQTHRPLSFWSGFLAVFLLWVSIAFFLDNQNHSLLSSQLFQLFPIDSIPDQWGSLFLILFTGLIGGLVGGLSSLTGSYLGEAVK